jgi:hypothetical protein
MHVFPSLSPTILSYLTIKRLKTSKMYLKKINNNANIRKTHPGGHCKFSIGPLTPDLCSLTLQTQEREAKAEMRRKAKELQQARRDAERSGKKVPAFGGFGNSGMTSISSGSIITDTIMEPEKPKMVAPPARYTAYIRCLEIRGLAGKESLLKFILLFYNGY